MPRSRRPCRPSSCRSKWHACRLRLSSRDYDDTLLPCYCACAPPSVAERGRTYALSRNYCLPPHPSVHLLCPLAAWSARLGGFVPRPGCWWAELQLGMSVSLSNVLFAPSNPTKNFVIGQLSPHTRTSYEELGSLYCTICCNLRGAAPSHCRMQAPHADPRKTRRLGYHSKHDAYRTKERPRSKFVEKAAAFYQHEQGL